MRCLACGAQGEDKRETWLLCGTDYERPARLISWGPARLLQTTLTEATPRAGRHGDTTPAATTNCRPARRSDTTIPSGEALRRHARRESSKANNCESIPYHYYQLHMSCRWRGNAGWAATEAWDRGSKEDVTATRQRAGAAMTEAAEMAGANSTQSVAAHIEEGASSIVPHLTCTLGRKTC